MNTRTDGRQIDNHMEAYSKDRANWLYTKAWEFPVKPPRRLGNEKNPALGASLSIAQLSLRHFITKTVALVIL
jgi:hypothetical protein